MSTAEKPRMGRISYLNVLPIYHALESGAVPHEYELVYGPPAALNNMAAAGELVAASTSCVEYARRPGRYFLLRDLAIGCRGRVRSVLLVSRVPVENLDGSSILVSAETHTSATLLRLLFNDYYKLRGISYHIGSATERAATGNPPVACLAIGDEALRLRKHPAYPHVLDLGEAWRAWTGLPFIFGVWVADRANLERWKGVTHPGELLAAGRDWATAHMETILDIAEANYPNMTRAEHAEYFGGLHYSLGEEEQAALALFWRKLADAGEIPACPEMRFLD